MKAPKPRHTLSLEEARRIALAAQGFLPFERTSKRKDRRRLARLFETVGLLQIDSVNALERSHYLPFFSRSGPYARSLLRGNPKPRRPGHIRLQRRTPRLTAVGMKERQDGS